MPRFGDLLVWQAAHALTLEIYRLTKSLPPDEAFGLTAQVRRAAVSIGANLAEGQRRRTKKDFRHFICVAEGSLAEVQYYLILSRDLGYLEPAEAARLEAQALEIEKMLAALYRSLDKPD